MANEAGSSAVGANGARRKRRARNGCANPLFVRWVEEWRDEAREKGSKTQYTYNKVQVNRLALVLRLNFGHWVKAPMGVYSVPGGSNNSNVCVILHVPLNRH